MVPQQATDELDVVFDLLVIGGGVNGVGIARDAVGRGLKVILCEREDLASATSSASSKLIHGGLRYLEQYEFRLVREALAEREVLLGIAPHIVRPLRFVLPHNATLRPAWMIRVGLFLYDHLAKRSRLPGSHGIDLRQGAEGAPLRTELTKGFVYSDCAVDDSRLVVLNAMDAAQRGAEILTRTACTAARREGTLWHATLTDEDGRTRPVKARALVNAAGPWVTDVLQHVLHANSRDHLRLVQGSHIVVPRLYEGDHAYILQNPDERIVFVIPYHRAYTLIGTTDVAYDGDPAVAAISPAETTYLCESVSRYFARQVRPDEVVWTYSGVRPLYDDADQNASANNPSTVTRDYVFDVSGGSDGTPPLLSVFGGKLTTYRRLAEHALDKLAPFLNASATGWTKTAPLPGGDLGGVSIEAFARDFAARHPWLPADLASRYVHSYGTLAAKLVGDALSLADLGEHLGSGLYAREVDYLVAHEWARSPDDILNRRTKLVIEANPAMRDRLAGWFAQNARSNPLAVSRAR
ncbi:MULTISPECIES: glycerol-3-phosphate dehydrogenase [unclassified Chelatococcus]|uniref:glycerol-3-phosphate dehydrogenase n=1 Tax=unclassified Chelatococcus TaxID=2638111 RepID=UPI001BCF4D6F|nr:glycerol-3-phosphate dehydrogenase [Chelatococcus sp.]MBS7739170.1 glycerol-3-phosphate dehydrogenase [Chelatococcus sp. HY11]CAH1670696.1 aerobic glycerol 3-phosphate dehydrogenase [Hyphomicrobiales bacterium]MBX3543660.1 glycerol-3-phosphate dehydrogenase [Chelatococcus sp.]MCO5076298.1 glycerol-3-phosphate dehydrogenase [Chelatococcus sp.]CAH1677105.1 aerobic glycerol 3-phosphate dehydrogenase [Hyphomicrobiales bacterium]